MANCQEMHESFECIMKNLHSIKSSLSREEGTEANPENLNLDNAINYLKENGYPISKSTLYKLTSGSAIPFYRFGNRLIFKRSELINWCNSKTVSNGNSKESVMAVSSSALKMIQNVKN